MHGGDGSCSAPAFDASTATANTTVTLRTGSAMPIIGLGGGLFGVDAEAAVFSALEEGYRLIDTSPKYGMSEASIGRALKRSGLKRADIFLVTKVGNVGYSAALKSLQSSLVALGTQYVDLLLMHSAVNQSAAKDPRSRLHASSRLETWRAMRELRDKKKACMQAHPAWKRHADRTQHACPHMLQVRAIGVCNYSPRHIDELIAAGETPEVLQMECVANLVVIALPSLSLLALRLANLLLVATCHMRYTLQICRYHPMLQRAATLEYCRSHGIVAQAYGSGGGGWQLWRKEPTLDLLSKEPIQQAAMAHSRSAHAISLRWALETGLCVIPKAAQREHQRENRLLFDFQLSEVQAAAIGALDEQRSLYRFPEPDTYL